MGLTTSSTFTGLKENALLQRLVGEEHVELSDPFWTNLLSFSFQWPLKSDDVRQLLDATTPLCREMAVNGSKSGNLYTLAQSFVWRAEVLSHHGHATEQNAVLTLHTYNSLLLLRILCQYLISSLTESKVMGFFSPVSPSPPYSPDLSNRSVTTAAEITTQSDTGEPHNARGSMVAEDLHKLSDFCATSGMERGYSNVEEDSDFSPHQLVSGELVQNVNKPKHASLVDSARSMVESRLLSKRKARNQVSNQVSVVDDNMAARLSVVQDLAEDRIDGSMESVLDCLCTLISQNPVNDAIYNVLLESMHLIIVLLSTQRSHNRMGIAFEHLIMNCECAKELVSALLKIYIKQPKPPDVASPPGLFSSLWSFLGRNAVSDGIGSPLAHLSLHLLLILTNYFNQKGQKNPFHFSLAWMGNERERYTEENGISFTLSFNLLYNTLCRELKDDESTLLLYLLLHGNPRMAAYIFSRTDLENLLIPLLRLLYATEQRSQHHIYMILIILLIFTQDDQFNRAIHETVLDQVPWFTERALGRVSLGSLVVLVVIRTLQYNMTRMRDKYLHTNCLAALANMSAGFRNLHPFVAQRILSLFEVLSRKHQRLMRVAEAGRDSSVEDQCWDVTTLEEILRMLLEIINSALTYMLGHNPHLVYALLHRQQLFPPYENHPVLQDIVANVMIVLSFFSTRLEVADSSSVDVVLKTIVEASRQWSRDRLRSFPDLRFKYVEEEHPEEFFVPYIWSLVVHSPLLCWHADLPEKQ